MTTALAVSGLPSEKFCFEGFAPQKALRADVLAQSLTAEQRTCVFFESHGGWRTACATRSPNWAQAARGGLPRADKDQRGDRPRLARRTSRWAADGVLGEITVVLAGAVPQADLPTLVAEVGALVDAGARVKDACAEVVAAHPGAPSRRELYDAVLRSRD